MTNEWIPVCGYKGFYSVNKKGLVRSEDRVICDKNGTKRLLKGRVLKTSLKRGYFGVILSLGGKIKTFKIHRLVALAFLQNNSPEKIQVNHINGNRLDNRVENLEWCTPKDNIKHSFKMGLSNPPRGQKHYRAKLSSDDVLKIRAMLKDGFKQKEIAKKYGVHRSTIGGIATGAKWAHLK